MAHLMLSLPRTVLADASPTLWYITRATATAAYVTLALTVILGMLRTIARRSGERLTWVVDDLHAFVATLTALLIVGHIVSLYLDPFLPFSLTHLLLPLPDQTYRPLAVNLGVITLYCVVAILASSWLRRRLPYGLWRNVHNLSFVAVILVTLHGWFAGSDANEPWLRALYGGVAGAIGFLIVVRIFAQPHKIANVATEVDELE